MSYEALQLLRANELGWPLTYRFHISGPFGGSQFELSVDAPSLVDDLEASKRLAPLLWVIGIAPAMTSSVQCDAIEMVAWRAGQTPIVLGGSNLSGNRLWSAEGREHAAVMVLHSGHHDRLALMRFYAAGMPTSWQDGGVLTKEGAEQMQQLARGWIGGMGVDAGAADPQLLIRRRVVIPGENLGHPVSGFRRVRHIRVCQYTAPVPMPGNLDWP